VAAHAPEPAVIAGHFDRALASEPDTPHRGEIDNGIREAVEKSRDPIDVRVPRLVA
jgi:hypothetical protein